MEFNSKTNNTIDSIVITDSYFIEDILNRAMRSRKIFCINIKNIETNYLSCIVEIDKSGKVLVFDELKPYSGNDNILEYRFINAETRLDKTLIKFDTELLHSESYGDFCEYRVRYPVFVEQIQQHQLDRFNVNNIAKIPVRIQRNKQWYDAGIIHDVSIDGIGIEIYDNFDHEVIDLGNIVNCQIKISESLNFLICVEVRYRYIEPSTHQTHTGLKFLYNTKAQANSLIQVIKQIEMHNLAMNESINDHNNDINNNFIDIEN